jgi:hypothetical protein
MTRAATSYNERAEAKHFEGFDASTPVAGCYRFRLRSGAVRRGVRIHFGPPCDPITGEELDRGWRWQATLDDGSLVDIERVWPVCADDPITEAEYRAYCERHAWAQQNAPQSAYADPRKRVDPLSAATPMLF